MPHSNGEVQEWMQGRHADLQAAVAGGHFLAVARVSQIITIAAQEELINRQSVTAIFCRKCRGINGAVMQFSPMRLRGRWGLRRVRVGEASHPGFSCNRRQSKLLKRGSIPKMPAHTD